MMARSLSVDSGYDRWKDSAVEQRSREPIGTFPSVTVRTGRSGNITDALVSTTEYQTNSGEKGEAQVQGMSGASVDRRWTLYFSDLNAMLTGSTLSDVVK